MQAGLFFVTSFACDSLKFIRFSFLLNGKWFEDATNCSIYLSLNLPFYTNRTNSLHSTVLPDQAKPLHNHTDSPLKPPKVKSIKKTKHDVLYCVTILHFISHLLEPKKGDFYIL